MRSTVCALLLWGWSFGFAQDASRIPVYLKQLDTVKTDLQRADLLNALCFHYADKDPTTGITYGERGLALAERTGNRKGIADAHNRMGYCRVRLSEFRVADSLCLLAAKEYSALGDRCGASLSLMNYGLSKEMRHDDAGALEQFQRAATEGETCPLREQRSALLYAMGGPYERLGRFEDALHMYRQCFVIDSAAHDSARQAKNHIAIANMLAALKRIDEAMDHYERSIQCSQAIGDTLMTGYVSYNCAEIELGRDQIAQAVEFGERAVQVFVQLDRRAERLHAEILLGQLYIASKRAADASVVLDHALELSIELGIRDERLQVLRSIADLHTLEGDPAKALEAIKAYMALKDSLAADAQQARLADLTEKYDSEKREKELEASKAREAIASASADRLRAQRTIYLGGALVLGALLVLFVSRYRMKRKAADALQVVNAEVVRQKERAEESERAKDRFLANVSHEIRTPLNAIMGFTGLLLHEHRDERSTRFLTSIREAGDNLLVVINDVLDLSRIEAGRLQLMKEPFDLHRTIRLCQEIMHHRAMEQGNTVIIALSKDVPHWVAGDSARLLQILLNLVGNALKFTSSGTVRIEAAVAEARIRFRVSDTGIGIPQEKLATIFDRFTQVDVTDQRRYGGAGLGLSIVKELVDLYSGTITVESETGRGTIFTVELPLVASDAPTTTSTAHRTTVSDGSLAGRTILVAEDNEMNALVTTETIRRYYPSAKAVVVRTGAEALAQVKEDEDGDIAVVLMDVQMPEMDGMTATRRIRELANERARVPVIALTASVLPSDLSRCLDAGMDACVSKPFKAAELLHAIGMLTGDHGSTAGVGFDVHDPQVALFHWLVPPRLKALKAAAKEEQDEEVLHIVHTLRPQLVERDEACFAPLCDRILHATNGAIADRRSAVQELVTAIEGALA